MDAKLKWAVTNFYEYIVAQLTVLLNCLKRIQSLISENDTNITLAKRMTIIIIVFILLVVCNSSDKTISCKEFPYSPSFVTHHGHLLFVTSSIAD